MAPKKTVPNFSKEEILKIDKLLQTHSIKEVAKLMGLTYIQLDYRCRLDPVLDKVVSDALKFKKSGKRPMGYLDFSEVKTEKVKIEKVISDSRYYNNEISPKQALINFQKKIKEEKRKRSLKELRNMEWL